MRFTIFQDSHIGGRKVNQDRLAYSYSRDVLLMVIADGMGGHARGEIAAEIAVNSVNNRFQQEARSPLRRPAEFLHNAFNAAHRAIVAFADQNDMLESPRTTLVACVIQDGKAWWAHTGDSRLYVLRRGGLAATTLDHSRVQQLIDAGLITQEMAATHPDRNKIYSCLGGVIPPEIALSQEWHLETGDSIVLSTDGFWSQVPATTMARKLQEDNILNLMPRFLKEAEQIAGNASDNLSVVALTWEKQDAEEIDTQTITSTVPLEGFRTQTNLETGGAAMSADEVSEEDIERAIAKIQNAIRKVSR